MKRTERPPPGDRGGRQYAAAGLFIATIAAVISYIDGLFVARLAGNTGWAGYLYPLLPDGLIVVCLQALYEAARLKVPRPRWATFGLVLGIVLTLAQNGGAGIAHSVLDAVMDGMVPVVFFVAAEVVLWRARRSRWAAAGGGLSAAGPGAVPSSAEQAAKVSMAATAAAGNPWSQNQLQVKFGLSRAQAREIWAAHAPDRGQGGKSAVSPAARSTAPALATQTPPAGGPRSPSEPMLGTATAGAAVNGDGRG